MVWCIGSDGHRALELSHEMGSTAKGFGGNALSALYLSTREVVSPTGTLGQVISCSSQFSSSADCVDTPVVSALPVRGLGLSKADQEVFKPLSAIVSYIPTAASPLRLARWSRPADATLDFTSLSMLRVVILQI